MPDETPQTPSLQQRLRDAWQFGRFAFRLLIVPWPPYGVFMAVIAIVGAVTPLVQIRATTGLIDALIARTSSGPAAERPLLALLEPYLPWLLLLVGIMIVHSIVFMASFQHYLAAQINERVRERFDRLFYDKALSLRLESFERPGVYDLMVRAYRTVNNMAAQPLYDLQRLISCTLGALTILWVLMEAHWGFSLMLLIGGLVMMRWSMAEERIFIEINHRQTPLQRRQAYWRNLLTERASAAEVRLFGLGEHILSAWRGLTERMIGEISAVRWRYVAATLTAMAILVVLYGLSLAGLLYLASKGELSPGKLIAFLYAIHHYLFFLHNNGFRIAKVQWFLSELRYVPEFLSLEEGEKKDGLRPPRLFQTDIRFEKVTFTYPGGSVPVLADIDLQIRPGERIALVGVNGSGKTTLVKLLLGLYRPTRGRILVDRIDLQQIAPDAWRSRVGAVFQDYVRYALTVRENIGFGRLEKLDDLDAIRTAAKRSAAAEPVEDLPRGYDTILGKEFQVGHDLSIGQWQKLAIARAYLRDARLLVLDEPASALDALAELEVYRRFAELSAGKTVLLISHRLGSARLADRVLFLKNGRISEEGAHADLMAAGGAYAELYDMQAEWYREQPEGA